MKKDTRMLMILAAGGALAYAISKEGSPLELPTGEGNGLVMQTQAKNAPVNMPSGQFNRMIDDIVTINGNRVIIINGLGQQDPKTGHIPGTPTVGVMGVNTNAAELNLVISQVNNALRNTSMFTSSQVTLLRAIKQRAVTGLTIFNIAPVSGYLSIDGIF
jgi:hypothetical protein